jgi:hypothetical protein
MPQWQVSRFRQWIHIIGPCSKDSVDCSTSTHLFTVDGLYYSTLGVIDINDDFPRTCSRFTSTTGNQVVSTMFDFNTGNHMVRFVL